MAFLTTGRPQTRTVALPGAESQVSSRHRAGFHRVTGSMYTWLLLLAFAGGARAEIYREYPLKAAFLYHFAQFTDWPTNAFTGKDDPLVIGVLGIDPFGPTLDETVRGETAHGRRLTVERYRTAKEIKTCHILFISQSESRQLEKIPDELKGKPVLTVSDIENSAQRGVMIRFITENNKIRFRVNLDAVNAAGLWLSSKFLRVAEVITPRRNP